MRGERLELNGRHGLRRALRALAPAPPASPLPTSSSHLVLHSFKGFRALAADEGPPGPALGLTASAGLPSVHVPFLGDPSRCPAAADAPRNRPTAHMHQHRP